MNREEPALTLRLATWNLHRGRGRDGRIDPGRTLSALLQTPELAGADILSLHEAEDEAAPYAGFLDLARLEAETGLRSVHAGADLRHGPASHGVIGTILLLRPPLAAARTVMLRMPGLYPRAAVLADIGPVVLAATHLSLAQPLRILQVRRIVRALAGLPRRPAVLMGDLNEWRPWLGLAFARPVAGRRFAGPPRATFPAARPVLPLDRILCEDPCTLTEVRAVSSPTLVAASDHLPLTATLRLRISAATSG
jgi:endonuclease/exonuclease/phosphatase family metal-dependent hydrolase